VNNRQIFIFLSAVAAIAIGLASLQAPDEDLRVDRSKIDEIPVTVFRSAQGKEGPVILIAHGFAGSQQLMQPMAATLAHSGYTAVTFDFAGHGRNEQPLSGGIKDFTKSEAALNAEIARMIQFAHTLSGGDQPLGLVGHSMASNLVIHAAIGRDDVAGVVALSAFGTGVTATEPRNLLVIDGAWEPEAVKEAGLRIINAASSGPAQEHVAYGDVEQGTARRFVLAGGAEHIGVI